MVEVSEILPSLRLFAAKTLEPTAAESAQSSKDRNCTQRHQSTGARSRGMRLKVQSWTSR